MTEADLRELTNGDLVRMEFNTGTAVEGRFMHTALYPVIQGPYLWLFDGKRVIDLGKYTLEQVTAIKVLKKWEGSE